MGVCTLRVQPTPAIHPCAGFSFQACPSSNRPDFFLFTPSHCLKKKCDTRRPTLVGDVGDPLRGYGAGACATLAADVYPRRPPRFGPPKRTSNGSNRTCAGTCRRHSAFRRYAHDFTDTPIQTFDRHGVCRDAGLSSEHVLALSQLREASLKRRISGVVPQGRHHRMDGDYAIGMPSVVILGGGWSGKLILSR